MMALVPFFYRQTCHGKDEVNVQSRSCIESTIGVNLKRCRRERLRLRHKSRVSFYSEWVYFFALLIWYAFVTPDDRRRQCRAAQIRFNWSISSQKALHTRTFISSSHIIRRIFQFCHIDGIWQIKYILLCPFNRTHNTHPWRLL
jgi:hypothetical protein